MTPVSLLIAAPALSYGLCENAEVIIFLLQLFDFVFNRVIDEPVVKKKKKRSHFVDCYGSDYHVTWTYFSTRNAWWLCAAISEIAPVTIKIVGTMVNLLEISRSD